MNDQNQSSKDFICLRCKWWISIPGFWLGRCSIHESEIHREKEYCRDFTMLKREVAYCNPKCELNERLLHNRPADSLGDYPETRELAKFPAGSLLKQEWDFIEAKRGAPLYMVLALGEVVRLDPKTRNRSTCDISNLTMMCLVSM